MVTRPFHPISTGRVWFSSGQGGGFRPLSSRGLQMFLSYREGPFLESFSYDLAIRDIFDPPAPTPWSPGLVASILNPHTAYESFSVGQTLHPSNAHAVSPLTACTWLGPKLIIHSSDHLEQWPREGESPLERVASSLYRRILLLCVHF